jgi:hypothetical protein
MSKQQVEIVRGTVVVPIGESPRGSGGRSFINQHLARPGEVVTLGVEDATRLARAGVVALVKAVP